MPAPDAALDDLVDAVRTGAYRAISGDVVRRVGARELAARRSFREAVKATKSRLHQVGGAYLGAPRYDRWLAALRDAHRAEGLGGLQRACRAVMAQHASTRERLPILERFYAETLAGLPPIRSVIDLACGLHPLSLPWLLPHLPPMDAVRYTAYDMYEDMAAFLREALALTPVRGEAVACDVLAPPPMEAADVALLLKAIPCLEQLDRAATRALLHRVPARYLLVSYPVASLGGRDVGMLRTYEARFREMVEGRGWRVERYAFETELVFRIERGHGRGEAL